MIKGEKKENIKNLSSTQLNDDDSTSSDEIIPIDQKQRTND